MLTISIIVVLIILSALFSGMTLGFFSLNKDDLERKAHLGDKEAKSVYQLRKNGNLLLCTLLIANVGVNTALSLFLGSMVSGLLAGISATVLIVLFGEIIPQAAFSRYALLFGARLVWFVRVLIFLLFPICFPIAWVLTKVLGTELRTIYTRPELIKMIEQHEDSKESDIDEEDERIIKGALSFTDKKVKKIMTPRDEMNTLHKDLKLTPATLKKIQRSGHSRIPVHGKNKYDIVGMLYVKDLIDKKSHNKKIADVARKKVRFVPENEPLDELLHDFKKTRTHLCMVRDKQGKVCGLVTIEDVIEEIIGAEIVDEFDKTPTKKNS